ncbi:hypothetical protein GCM10023206_25510 [Acinetobacter puyangensis]|uniref:Uncharacterized protein n=1 Tax=Acinetobacter puyangensis TaxID=1096779 RepID=A0A240E726_9GAMM|nr:hypothetical protein [Acinetobacter puyangensis]SNX43680.1 hypothetical protein SAMN05421731_101722 [Acinetobacter puyangensis]
MSNIPRNGYGIDFSINEWLNFLGFPVFAAIVGVLIGGVISKVLNFGNIGTMILISGLAGIAYSYVSTYYSPNKNLIINLVVIGIGGFIIYTALMSYFNKMAVEIITNTSLSDIHSTIQYMENHDSEIRAFQVSWAISLILGIVICIKRGKHFSDKTIKV